MNLTLPPLRATKHTVGCSRIWFYSFPSTVERSAANTGTPMRVGQGLHESHMAKLPRADSTLQVKWTDWRCTFDISQQKGHPFWPRRGSLDERHRWHWSKWEVVKQYTSESIPAFQDELGCGCGSIWRSPKQKIRGLRCILVSDLVVLVGCLTFWAGFRPSFLMHQACLAFCVDPFMQKTNFRTDCREATDWLVMRF